MQRNKFRFEKPELRKKKNCRVNFFNTLHPSRYFFLAFHEKIKIIIFIIRNSIFKTNFYFQFPRKFFRTRIENMKSINLNIYRRRVYYPGI